MNDGENQKKRLLIILKMDGALTWPFQKPEFTEAAGFLICTIQMIKNSKTNLLNIDKAAKKDSSDKPNKTQCDAALKMDKLKNGLSLYLKGALCSIALRYLGLQKLFKNMAHLKLQGLKIILALLSMIQKQN